jgi:hypothetical protein
LLPVVARLLLVALSLRIDGPAGVKDYGSDRMSSDMIEHRIAKCATVLEGLVVALQPEKRSARRVKGDEAARVVSQGGLFQRRRESSGVGIAPQNETLASIGRSNTADGAGALVTPIPDVDGAVH